MSAIASPIAQRRKEPDDEQLLKLFWNRAELKKELAQLRREKNKLLDQLRQQESLNMRSQQRLDQLENLLADPLQATHALVYYQLRGVWQQCRKRLLRVARELSERQKAREEEHARGLFEAERNEELASIDARMADLDNRARVLTNDVEALERQVAALRGFWNYFRRRAALERVDAARATHDGLKTQLERLAALRREKTGEHGPSFEGLSIEGKRNINLAIVAMAQQLLVHFADHNVAGLAREAAIKELADVSYGTVAECQDLGQRIEAVVRRLQPAEKLNAIVRHRAENLKHAAEYRRDIDTVPVACSFATVPLALSETNTGSLDNREIPVNVLADEYWDIYAVLLT